MLSTRTWIVAGAIVAMVGLFVLLRPSGDSDEGGAPAAAPTTGQQAEEAAPPTGGDTSTAATVEAPGTTTAPNAEAAPPKPTLVIRLQGGKPVGGLARVSVPQGEKVRLIVRSDLQDSLHLHGYDIEKRVAPGAPAIFQFTASIPGRFELESHEGGGQVGQLDVTP